LASCESYDSNGSSDFFSEFLILASWDHENWHLLKVIQWLFCAAFQEKWLFLPLYFSKNDKNTVIKC